MANLLSNLVEVERLTPVFPSEQSISSSTIEASERAIPKIYVCTQKTLKKEGDVLIIEGEVISISKKTVLGFLNILLERGIEACFINDDKFQNYPALCLRDFSNEETEEVYIRNTPYNLVELLEMKTNSIVVIETPKIVRHITTDLFRNKIEGDVRGNSLVIPNFSEECKFMYVKRCEEFAILLGDTFTTSSLETVGRYLDHDKNTV